MTATARLTAKGTATRARIVAAAADLVLARGVGGTSLDDVRAGTLTSKSQLFHYFPGGKSELVLAIAELQMQRVLQAQQPYLETLDTWAAWDGWRDALVAHYASQPHQGCPIGTLVSELVGTDPTAAAEVVGHLNRWRAYLRDGLTRMHEAGLLRPDADPDRLALATFASVQGGLLLSQALQSVEPLSAALEAALAALHAAAPDGQAGTAA
ncbi:TetR/AcrR family transcriptional regulator [Catellatospora citrea]|uniref:TetR family transcriptional regulator n=1 Tax=Catellatospora citrea TaxID=53366 RepID=A0A8J3P0W6_9ACTN|nr:TetR family transcriptional regulator C-terminal domain-containing protein [Catellatospora citrea]RKE11428.1 TetR family transcriptional regulator [Catellatospora citrea]GIF99925.1 TetR family transcriptional regulator [Catellatospora citrea]